VPDAMAKGWSRGGLGGEDSGHGEEVRRARSGTREPAGENRAGEGRNSHSEGARLGEI
jgi:hypothetical protein